MKRLALWVDPAYGNDALFDPASGLNRDNCLSSFRLLKEAVSLKGWDCHTQDVFKANGTVPDAVLFIDIPRLPVEVLLGSWRSRSRRFVILNECAVIKPENWDLSRHQQFDGVFTWDAGLVDNRKYYKTNFANPLPETIPDALELKQKFCVMIAAHKKRRHPLELYSERENTIRWFEANHPGDFDLYGVNWDAYTFNGPAPVRLLNRIKPLTRFLAPSFPSYRGKVALKKTVMQQYRFAICYENAKGVPGYITEKIFDCFFAGTVPVYWGAPDIASYVPEACFIDRRKFASHEQLYAFLKKMTDHEWKEKIEAARSFLHSGKAYPFTDHYFAETVAGVITRE